MSGVAMCATHPDALAGWRCDAATCRKHLCGECTAKVVTTYACGLCGATASQLRVPRAERGYQVWLGRALASTLTRGLVGCAVVAILLAVIAFVLERVEVGPAKTDVVRGGLVWAYALVVADGAARGHVAERGALVRLGRGVVATMIVWGPGLLYLWLLGIPARGLAADRVLWLYAGLAVIYLPIAIATASTDASYADAANPFKLFELAWHLGRRYVTTFVAVLCASALAYGLGASTVDKLHAAVAAPIATDVVAALPALAGVTLVATLIGLLPYVHGDRFGWGDAAAYADPLHPRLVASARRKAGGPELGADQAAIAAAALAERNDARKIHDALKDDNLPRALRTYEARATWAPTSLDEAKLLQLGKGAARAKRYDLAQRILEDALARKGRAAGQVLVALAQVAADRGDAAGAEALYRRVLAEHPNSDAAKAATLKLKT